MTLPGKLRLLPPVTIGNRIFCPVIRESDYTSRHGMVISVSPSALLLHEEETWYFVPLEDGSSPDMFRDLPEETDLL